MKIITLTICFMFFCSSFASAAKDDSLERIMRDLEAAVNSGHFDPIEGAYFQGMVNSLMVSNAFLGFGGYRKIYCQPGEMILSLKEYAVIAIDEYKKSNAQFDRNPNEDTSLVELSYLLLGGLVKRFPCPK